ncbi:MAG: tRNA (adenosine(37)-N6)-dimethylallyltransferase MiaA [Gammaproteobacteria bacterium]|nr:tRNA (adenosine(37)-N6)-dimethylallyltransferase MiaA [Gammaproteobacteria bacterium]
MDAPDWGVPVLTGPTGAGKTDWALRLADELPLEIVSVDSALVYRGMDIGTAKPGVAARTRVPHHLIDIRDPGQSYSAGEFVSDARRAIEAIRARGRLPLLVGGTMLYLRALRGGLADLPQAAPELRRTLDARAATEGWMALHAELRRLDPLAAARIHPNDPQRIQRALEVCITTGQPLSQLQRERASTVSPGEFRTWAVAPERARLHARIEQRLHAMFAAGFLEEVRALRQRGDLTATHPSMRAVGYRQLWACLDGSGTLEDAERRAVAATRQLARRQLTWLRADAGVTWLDPEVPGAYDQWARELRRLWTFARS